MEPASKPDRASAATRKWQERRAKTRFMRAAKGLQNALDEARKVWPDAELYLAVATLNLMSGPHHEGTGAQARPERVLAGVTIRGIDGGDW